VSDLGDIWEWEFLEAPKEDERGGISDRGNSPEGMVG